MVATPATEQSDSAPPADHGRDGLGLRRPRAWAGPAALVAAVLVPLVITSPFRLQIFTVAFLNASVVASLVMSLGYVGMLNLSQGTFYGLGAYTTAILVTDHGWPFILALLAAAIVAGAAGVLLSVASVRVKGDYFVLVSLGTTIAVAQLLANLPELTRGREGFFGLPPMSVLGLSFNDPVTSYYLCLGLLAVVCACVYRVTRGFLGRAMLIVRYDDVAARSMGIPLFRIRATAMMLSSTLAGLSGAFLVGTLQFISPADFNFESSFVFSLYVIIGGMASLSGSVAVAMVFTFINEAFRGLSDYSLGVVGLAVLIAVFLRAGVVATQLRNWRQRRPAEA